MARSDRRWLPQAGWSRCLWNTALTLLLGGAVGASAFAQGDDRAGADRGMETQGAVGDLDDPGGVNVSFQLAYYGHDDGPGDGNPFLDEELTVIEPVLIYDQTLTETFGYTATLTYDRVTSASIERLSKFDGQSGASGDNYVGLDLGFRHQLNDELRVGWHVGASVEYDYNSIGLGGTATFEPKGGERVLSLGLDGYFDIIDIIRFDGSSDEGSENRGSVTLNASWWQLLSPSMWGELGLTVARQQGFLSTPYNAFVVLDPNLPPNTNLDNLARGIELNEVLPQDRMRYALWGRLRQRLRPGTAVELGGRLYNDDWGINSFTLEPALYQTLVQDKLDLMLRYRYYNQTAADYFDLDVQVGDAEEFRTQDSDLGEFDTNSLGARLVWYRSANQSLDFGLDFATRSDGLDYIYASIGWSMSY